MTRSSTAWLVAGGVLLLAIGAVAGLNALVPTPAGGADATPTLYPSVATPSAQGPNSAGHTLVQVGEDLVANPPEYALSVGPDETVVSATALARRGDVHIYGVLTESDTVYLSVANPSEGTAFGQKVSYDDFVKKGITLDTEPGTLTWQANGTVTWSD